MLRRIIVPVVCIAGVAGAQTPPMFKVMLEQLQRQGALGLLVVEEEGKGKPRELIPALTGFEKDIRKALRNEALADLTIEVVPMAAAGADTFATWVRGQYGLGAGRGWVLVDGEGKCLAKGVEPPTSDELSQVLQRSGIQSPTRALRTFLKTHGNHLEARCELIRQLRRVAERRTRALLNVPVKTLQEDMREGKFKLGLSGGQNVPEMPKDIRNLTPEEDLLIWSTYAEEVDRIFREDLWQEADFGFVDAESLPLEVYSPTLKEIYRRHLPRVEQALTARPGFSDLWNVWVWMVRVVGDRPARPFYLRLEPMPESYREGPWPPRVLRELLVKEARGAKDWQGLRDLLNPHWEEQREAITAIRGVSPKGGEQQMAFVLNNLFLEAFDEVVDPLLEALIRSGEGGGAESLASEVLGWGWEPGPSRLSAVATRCERRDLASRWSRPVAK